MVSCLLGWLARRASPAGGRAGKALRALGFSAPHMCTHRCTRVPMLFQGFSRFLNGLRASSVSPLDSSQNAD
eukprot:16430895-Heterocapsa_arctica.AAC.1